VRSELNRDTAAIEASFAAKAEARDRFRSAGRDLDAAARASASVQILALDTGAVVGNASELAPPPDRCRPSARRVEAVLQQLLPRRRGPSPPLPAAIWLIR
jgi:hypothetical protein